MPYGIPGSATLPPPMPGAARAPMALPKNVIRIGEQAIWSAQSYDAAHPLANTEDRIFTAQRGSVAQGWPIPMSLAETSQKEPSRVPGGFAFTVDAIALHPYYYAGVEAAGWPIVYADLANIANHLVLSWDFLQTRIEVSPAVLIGAGGGQFGSTADTAGVVGGGIGSMVALNHGAANVWLYRRFPVMLPADATFAQVLQWGAHALPVDGGTNASALAIRAMLLGQFETAIAVG